MKRLIICADGTWDTVDHVDPARKKEMNLTRNTRNPTNVVKMSRAISPVSADGTHQVVYYDEGVGTGFGLLDPLLGGMFGVGLSKNVTECYRFLVHNYSEGDEIYLFGFSRGAFTARSLAGLIGRIGLLTKDDAYYIPEAYDFYRLRTYENPKEMDRAIYESVPRWLPSFLRVPLANKKRAILQEIGQENKEKITLFTQGKRKHPETGEAVRFGRRNDPTRMVNIKFIGVWDTVGALGVPYNIAPFKWINQRATFHNVELGDRVQYAYHALAIDEKRKPFRPTLWEKEKGPDQTIEQVWFAGYHSDIGGGLYPSRIENFAFRWMAEKAQGAGLDLDERYMRFYREREEDLGYWLRDSMAWFWRPMGTYIRKIPNGDFCYESIHPSAEARLKLASPVKGSKEKWPYAPSNLLEYLKAKEKDNNLQL